MKKLFLFSTLALLALTGCAHSSSQQTSSANEAKTSVSKETKTSSETASTAEDSMKTKTIDPKAIANGDFSSIKGTWTNQDGHTLTFDDSGLTTEGYEFGGASVTDYGTASSGVYANEAPGGFLLEFIPANVVLPDFTDSETGNIYKDTSNHKKNRLWAGQGLVSRGSEGSFYYKTK